MWVPLQVFSNRCSWFRAAVQRYQRIIEDVPEPRKIRCLRSYCGNNWSTLPKCRLDILTAKTAQNYLRKTRTSYVGVLQVQAGWCKKRKRNWISSPSNFRDCWELCDQNLRIQRARHWTQARPTRTPWRLPHWLQFSDIQETLNNYWWIWRINKLWIVVFDSANDIDFIVGFLACNLFMCFDLFKNYFPFLVHSWLNITSPLLKTSWLMKFTYKAKIVRRKSKIVTEL